MSFFKNLDFSWFKIKVNSPQIVFKVNYLMIWFDDYILSPIASILFSELKIEFIIGCSLSCKYWYC